MATTFASLGLGQLNVEEKLDVVGELWEDLIATAPPGSLLTEAQRRELQKRVADAAANPDDWVSWDDALAATLQRLTK